MSAFMIHARVRKHWLQRGGVCVCVCVGWCVCMCVWEKSRIFGVSVNLYIWGER